MTLAVNGAVRQEGDLDQMIWKVPEMIAYLSRYFELAAGDVILTGTPAGVGGGGRAATGWRRGSPACRRSSSG